MTFITFFIFIKNMIQLTRGNSMIKIICIGKLKEKYLIDGVNDYLKRLTKYHKINRITR